MKKITIVTGHYGSGKTNFSVNLAVRAAQEGADAAIVDLDIVNPYFRTADFRQLFEEKGIKLIAPDFANSNLDIPSIQFDVVQLAMNEDRLIIDVGGDDAGAFALGRYAALFFARYFFTSLSRTIVLATTPLCIAGSLSASEKS